SLTSVMSKAFADKLNQFIEKPCNLYFSDINVNDAQGYVIIAEVSWLNKVKGIIDLKKEQFKFTWENKSYILPITCWEKPQYNNMRMDEYESSDNELEESKGFLVIGNSDKKPIFEINNTQ
ncbi:8641_t:CDS:2, partial [Racocetra persica]